MENETAAPTGANDEPRPVEPHPAGTDIFSVEDMFERPWEMGPEPVPVPEAEVPR